MLEGTARIPRRRLAKIVVVLVALSVILVASLVVYVPSLFPQLYTYSNPDALEFGASVNATAVYPGHGLGVEVWDANTLESDNNLSLPKEVLQGDWENISLSPCSSWADYPYGIAVYQGHETFSNLSLGKLVTTFYPGYSFCPIATEVTSFTFEPLQNVSINIAIDGQWNSGSLSPLSPGPYTLFAGDVWGHYRIVYFEVVEP